MHAPSRSGFSRVARAALFGEAAQCARVVLSWTAAGGITAGGVLIGVAALGAPEMARSLLPLAPVLFVIGAAGGLLHGCILAFLGRPPDAAPGNVLTALAIAAVLSVPALVVAWVAAAWISLTFAALAIRTPSTILLVSVGWLVGAAVCYWAAVEGVRAFRCAFSRWPESRPGTLLLAGAGAIFATVFVGYQPQIWWTDVRVTGIGAVILALVATVWIALPVIVLLLHYLHRRFASVWDGPTAGDRIVQTDR